MAKGTTHNAEQVIEAIKGTGGIKVAIARRLNVSRWTVDNYIERWATVKDAYLEECEAVTDMAETNLIQEIKDRNFQAIKFYLQTKGKDRGYVERQELSGADGDPVSIKFIDYGLTKDDDADTN